MDALTVRHNLTINGRYTSVSVEAPFWAAFVEIAAEKRVTVGELASAVDEAWRAGEISHASTLSAAIRLYVLGVQRRAGGKER